MKPITEITHEEWAQIKAHKAKAMYSQDEAMNLFNLVRLLINDRISTCMTCGNAFREAKTILAEWHNAHFNEIEDMLNKPLISPEIDPIDIKNNINEEQNTINQEEDKLPKNIQNYVNKKKKK